MTNRKLSKSIALVLAFMFVLSLVCTSAFAVAKKSEYTVKVLNGVLTLLKNGKKLNPTYPIDAEKEVRLLVENGRLVLSYTDRTGSAKTLRMGNAALDEWAVQGNIPILTLDKSLGGKKVTLAAKSNIGVLNVKNGGPVILYGTVGQCNVDGATTLTIKAKAVVKKMRMLNSGATVNIDSRGILTALEAVPGVTLNNKNKKSPPEETELEATLDLASTGTPTPTPTPSAPIIGGGGGGWSSTVYVSSIVVTGASGATAVENGSVLQMNAAVLPANADNKTITWSVASGTGTATINAGGLLTATGVGTVTVTATNTASGVKGSLVVTVTAQIVKATSIIVTGAGNATSVINGSTLQMNVAVLPANATDKAITWSVAPGTGTATINAGGLLSATGVGTVTVTATNTASGVKGILVVTVNAPAAKDIPITEGNVAVVNATTVAVTMAQLDGAAFTWNGVSAAGTFAGGKYTLTIPTITKTANTLVVNANGYNTKTVPVTISASIDNLKLISNVSELSSAIIAQDNGQSWIIKAGTYDMPMDKVFKAQGVDENWYFPIHKSILISGEGTPLLTSSTFSANGSWASQNFITVFANDVTIQGLNIKCKPETNKAIEVCGQDFTLKNVNLLANIIPKDVDETTKGTLFSGSIYFNPCTPSSSGPAINGNDVGSALLENVTLSAWISVPSSITKGTVTLKNVTNDFRNNFYADYLYKGTRYEYGVISKNNVIKAQGFKVLVDNIVYGLQKNVLDRVPDGTLVELAAGTYYVPAALSIPSGIQVDQSAASIVIGRLIYAIPGEIASTIYNLEKDDILMLNAGAYTISGQAYLFKDNIRIIGAGIDKTVIKVQNAASGWGITVSGALNPSSAATNAYLEGFTIQRGTASGTSNVIKVNADHATLKNIKIIGGKGLDVNPSKGTVLDGVSVQDSIGVSIAISDGSEVTIKNSTTTNGAWGSLGVMENGAVSQVTIGENNTFNEGALYCEKYSTKGNQITGLGSEWTSYVNERDQLVYVKQLPKGAYISTDTVTRGYTTIQAAIAAAKHKDMITVAAGSYDLNAGLALTDDITLIGVGSVIMTADEAPVLRPLTTTHGQNPIVWIKDANVTIKNITFKATNMLGYTPVDGITAVNSDVTLESVVVTDIMNAGGYNGMQYGRAYTGHEGTNTIIKDCTFSNFNKNGVHFYGSRTTGSVDHSNFTGTYQTVGSTAQNGVVFHNGAKGSVTNSRFESLWYAGLDTAAGVLSFGAGSNANVSGSTFINVEVPVSTSDGGTATESGNTVIAPVNTILHNPSDASTPVFADGTPGHSGYFLQMEFQVSRDLDLTNPATQFVSYYEYSTDGGNTAQPVLDNLGQVFARSKEWGFIRYLIGTQLQPQPDVLVVGTNYMFVTSGNTINRLNSLYNLAAGTAYKVRVVYEITDEAGYKTTTRSPWVNFTR